MKKFLSMSTTKKLIIFLFGSCILIELFVCYVTLANLNLAATMGTPLDFTPLVTLIGAIVGEVVAYAVYCLKATKENTAGGITYDLAMQNNSVVSE